VRGRAGLVLAGVLSVLALPPLNIWPVLWLCLPMLLVAVERGRPGWPAFRAGWLFGFGFFCAGLYWIANALLVDAARFGWLVPFAIGGLAASLAVYLGAVTALTRLAQPGWPRLLLLAAAWGAAEALRGRLLTGFPWNPIASVWSRSDAMLQSIAVIGCTGLGTLTVAAAAAPAVWWHGRRQGAWATGAGLALLALLWAGGMIRLPAAAMPSQPGVRLRLVQANIAQTLKWRPELRAENLQRQLALSRTPAMQPPTVIIWPETAAPSFLDQDAEARQAIAGVAPPGGLMLVGSVRGQFQDRQLVRIWNSLEAIDGDGRMLASYDKAHLVPFGEYMPLPSWIPLVKVTAGSLDFTAGPGPRTLTLAGLPPVGPLICYEVIFPAAVVDRRQRPDWLLNLTNDGWYGVSSGPYQHLVAARLRAVEEGLPLVRAANSGISAVIDPYGRVVASLGLDQAGVLDADLPRPIEATFFARAGWLILPLLLAATALAAALPSRRHRHQHVPQGKKYRELLTRPRCYAK